ncbi:hypothetical protein JX265_012091 [Neoarthrinium moseri]|uniref:Uncharacterized protein n=1 Tax=Neoarthrinium moseri TaxID=1658444 RepID=A0A9Q0AK26_9PEZI|nr:hypothetical protein JX266_004843 [Neoarthrinium moseri]KAI1855828.1 hypothetical protein JX265_012091 [Neoarthrinium moseri]
MDLDTPPPSAVPNGAAAAAEDDADPIIASYNVFTNPAPASTRKILILQHPNKQGDMRGDNPPLSEVRVKPSSGMLEVDVPLSYHDGSYDRDKGMRWGQALQRSMNQKNGGSHGLAGGFGVGVPAPRAGRRKEEDRETYDWTEAVRRDQVLRTQTLGGQYAGRNAEDEECKWMVGVFKGGNLHLTPAQSEIQLRPQLHHLDAVAEQDRLTRPREGQGPGLGGAGPGKDGPGAGAQPAPKAITMTIKTTASGDQLVTETMADRLRMVQMENWQKLRFVDEDADDAWELYNKTLLYRSPAALAEAGAQDPKGKGKEAAVKLDEDEKEDLEHRATRLRTRWGEEDLLHAIAGKDRQGVLEGYGNTSMPGIKPEDVVEDGAVKKEGADGSAAGARKPSAVAAAKGKAKATATAATAGPSTAARRAPAKGKAPA